MAGSISEQKSALRRQVQVLLKNQTAAERVAASTRAIALLKQQRIWKNARAVLFYGPLPEELDIWPLAGEALAGGKAVALPRFDSTSGAYVTCQVQNLAEDLREGRFDIREPKAYCPKTVLNELDLALVPGVAFDLQGRRLGRGKGYYDRLLAAMRGTTCGIAFDQQILGEIPAEPHDLIVNCILTPTRWIEPKQRAVPE